MSGALELSAADALKERAEDERAILALDLIGSGTPFDEVDRRLGLRSGSALKLYFDVAGALGEDVVSH